MADTDTGDPGLAAPIGWPAAVVAVAIVTLVGAITVAAIVQYETPDDALEVWTAMSGLVGLITGVFVTYFFTRGAVEQAESQARQSRQLARSAQQLAEREADRANVAQRDAGRDGRPCRQGRVDATTRGHNRPTCPVGWVSPVPGPGHSSGRGRTAEEDRRWRH